MRHQGLAISVTIVVVASSLGGRAHASPKTPGDIARDPTLVYQHLPTQGGGLASDTDFINLSGNPSWQYLADDVVLDASAMVGQISVWAFYHEDNPPSLETLRLRFYAPRESDGLPGEVLYEESFLNAPHLATGRRIFTGVDPYEYLFDLTLTTPFAISENTLYWMEFVQIGDQGTHFRWEDGESIASDRVAVQNRYYPNWYMSPDRRNAAFQLWAVPEPGSLALLALGFACVRRRRS